MSTYNYCQSIFTTAATIEVVTTKSDYRHERHSISLSLSLAQPQHLSHQHALVLLRHNLTCGMTASRRHRRPRSIVDDCSSADHLAVISMLSTVLMPLYSPTVYPVPYCFLRCHYLADVNNSIDFSDGVAVASHSLIISAPLSKIVLRYSLLDVGPHRFSGEKKHRHPAADDDEPINAKLGHSVALFDSHKAVAVISQYYA